MKKTIAFISLMLFASSILAQNVGQTTQLYLIPGTDQMYTADQADETFLPKTAYITVNGDIEHKYELKNNPDLSIQFTQKQADWTDNETNSVSFIQHKPDLKPVATSGSYSDLSNTPYSVTLTLNVVHGTETNLITFNVISATEGAQSGTIEIPVQTVPALGDLTNVSLTEPVSDGQALVFNGTEWTNALVSNVSVEDLSTTGTDIGKIIINGTTNLLKVPDSGDKVSITGLLQTGTDIGVLTINGTNNTIKVPTITPGDTVSYDNLIANNRVQIGYLTINGDTNHPVYAPRAESGSTVVWTPIQTSGTEIAKISIDNQNPISVYAPTVDTTPFVKKAGDTMTGALSNEVAIAVGTGAEVNDKSNIFVFNGDSSSTYAAQSNGTFNINPVDGIQGFRIGDSNLYEYVFFRMLDLYTNKNYSKARNVDELIANEEKIWQIIRDYSNYLNDPDIRDANNDSSFIPQTRDTPTLLGVSGSSTIFTNEYFNGHYETSNIVTFYPFYSVGKRFINFGSDFNAPLESRNIGLTPFGLANKWHGTDPIIPTPGSNTNAEAMIILSDGYTRSGAVAENAYDPLRDAGKFTLMAWVYRNDTNSTPNTASRIVADLAGTTTGPGFQLRFSSGGSLQLFINPTANTQSEHVDSSDSLIVAPNSASWHHIAVSFDNSKTGGSAGLTNATVQFYLDGINFDHKSSAKNYNYKSKKTVSPNSASLTIGCSSGADTYDGQFIGLIDDVIIFKDWVPYDYLSIPNPITNTNWTDEEIVQFWMNMNDSILGKPNISSESIDFGQFDPNDTIYSASQINDMLNIPQGEYDETRFGVFDPRRRIYSADQIDDLILEYYHQ